MVLVALTHQVLMRVEHAQRPLSVVAGGGGETPRLHRSNHQFRICVALGANVDSASLVESAAFEHDVDSYGAFVHLADRNIRCGSGTVI